MQGVSTPGELESPTSCSVVRQLPFVNIGTLEPTTGYALLGDQRVAYQIIGDRPIDAVFTLGFWSSIDVEWEDPGHRLFIQQLASFARIIRFDQRGAGASDAMAADALPPWESYADEIEAVMDAAGSTEAAIIAGGTAGPVAMLYAATRPERVSALVLLQTTVRYLEDDDYPQGWSREQALEWQSRFWKAWGTGEVFDLLYPSRAGDERLRAWHAKLERSIAGPGAIRRYQATETETDARALLASIRAPTLVVHRPDTGFAPLAWGEYIADHIAGARLVTLPGRDVAPWYENPQQTLDVIEEFIVGAPKREPADRRLASVLFTDIVDSTGRADAFGDRRWRTVLDLHDGLASQTVADNGGQLLRSTGDGILATFDGPGRAINAAEAFRGELARADLQIRCGVHTGEVELRGSGIDGIAVHLAARIMAAAEAGEILVSGTVKDLVIGSDIAFTDRGSHTLKGLEGPWRLYAVA